MKKEALMISLVSMLLILALQSNAYLDCTTPNCPSGYEDQGTSCDFSSCTRTCVQSICNQSAWTEVFTNSSGWNIFTNADNIQGQTLGYTPSRKDKCYQFNFVPPPVSGVNMQVFGNPPECDTEGAAGFKASEPAWFMNLTVYINYGSVNGNSWDNYKLVPARGSADNDGTSPYYSNMATSGVIYCANNSVACSQLPNGIDRCATGCYTQSTYAHAHQGWLFKVGSSTNTLHNNNACGFTSATQNTYNTFYLNVSESNMDLIRNDQTCFKTNEAPSVNNVIVIPLTPNAGQDLECTFNYTDVENFLEQNSTFEWRKNGVNQNINSQILDKGNLTISDSWYCKVTPSDGLLFGNKTQSQNNVTIFTTIKDPTFKIGSLTIWSKNGYYGQKEEVLNFNQQLNDALSTCTPDQQGFCDINLTFSSITTGVLDLTQLEVFYTTPVNLVFNLTNLTSSFSNTIIEFGILNNNLPPANFSWNVNFGDGTTVNSTTNTFLNANEDTFILSQYAYSSAGTYNITTTAISGGNSDSEILTVKVT